ncbi:helix-hairpin-helix domain-containing protein [Pseudomonas sp. 148P]|uniref:Helix-hairpin-helix domain-containing protein n=1 Tax=Pseudomonas ulcerans TaxID=3115852 RepID=A0ABU7HYU9_9PSED|nr:MULTISPECIES: helix-hairpin-helix domain-containing protein [unclassified Pseudomonas]MEE1922837.1 helix-hairpin-helix domain-containing protein [Pseudomonas sp. 147P]MEE1936737.1 helix-hairpin-helix domain-containing protein [Pseudomonas sp. 148P]
MRHTYLASVLFALIGAISLPLSAASATAVPSAGVATTTLQTVTLDLNKADAATLQSQLSGIGKSKAEAIVAYREEHGDFASVDELLEIKGIGKALLERNRDRLTVN